MRESIDFDLKAIAILLAEVLSYCEAATRLGLTETQVKNAIFELEEALCLRLFDSVADDVRLTHEGSYMIDAFREALRRRRSRSFERFEP